MLKNKNIVSQAKITVWQRMFFLFSFVLITSALVFFCNLGSSMLMDIVTEKDIIDYDWRNIFLLLSLPVGIYFDVLVFFVIFSPLTIRLAHVYLKMMNVVTVYGVFVLIISIPVSLLIHFYPLGTHYYSCGDGGPLSGIHYAKKKEMCKQFEYAPKSESDSLPSAMIPDKDIK